MSMALTFAIPGDITTLTGGYVYDRRLLLELRARGMDVRHCVLPAGFPFPAISELNETQRLLQAAATPLLVDGLAYGALPENMVAGLPHPLVALCHHPLGLEAGLSASQSARLLACEAAALKHADHIIVTSPATADTLVAQLDVPRNKITAAVPGTDPAPRALAHAGKRLAGPVRLFAAGSVIPRKAYNVLVAALEGVAGDWRLEIAGSAARAPETAQALKEQIFAANLGDRIHIIGELSPPELAQAYARADVFVMPSLYEGFGMVLTEAMARGLPLVASTGGAASLTVPDPCALKVPPGDAAALRSALSLIIADADLRQQLAAASWRHGQTLARWSDTAALVAGVVAGLQA